MDKEFQTLLETIAAIDKLKSVFRQSDTLDGTRKENSAEHSWQCALMALLFRPYLSAPIDMEKVLGMLVIHDTGEIGAGDAPLYGDHDPADQYRCELASVRSLFAATAPDLVELWQEFEAGHTPEAQYARAIDRIAGVLSSHFNHSGCWAEEGMTPEKILSRNKPIRSGLPTVWPMIEAMVRKADERGQIGTQRKEDSTS